MRIAASTTVRPASATLRGWSAALAAAALIVVALPAAAAPPADEARDLLRQGVQLRKQGQDEVALEVIQKAHRLHPTGLSSAQLGLCEQALGRLPDAELHISEALARPADPWIRKNRVVLEAALKVISQRLGTLKVEIVATSGPAPAGAELRVNGQPARGHGPLRLPPGEASIEVQAAGFVGQTRRVAIVATQTVSERFELVPTVAVAIVPAPLPPVERPASSVRRILAWATAGGAVAFLATGIVGAVVHEQRVDNFNGPACLSSTAGRVDNCPNLYNQVQATQKLEIAGFVVGGALAATSALLFFLPTKIPLLERASLDWELGPGRLGLLCGRRF